MTAITPSATLTPEQRQQAHSDGCFVVAGLLSPEQCRAYLARLTAYASGARPLPPGLSIQREPQVARGELAATPGEDVRKITGVANGDDLFRQLAA